METRCLITQRKLPWKETLSLFFSGARHGYWTWVRVKPEYQFIGPDDPRYNEDYAHGVKHVLRPDSIELLQKPK